jgi:hypothetical protein
MSDMLHSDTKKDSTAEPRKPYTLILFGPSRLRSLISRFGASLASLVLRSVLVSSLNRYSLLHPSTVTLHPHS